MKKVLALALAAVMIMALCGSAMANTITIESKAPAGSTNTTTYTLYKILNIDKAASTDLGTPDENTGITNDLASGVSYYLNSPADDTLAGLIDATTYLSTTKSADGTRWIVTASGNPTGVQLAESLNTDAIKGAALATDTKTASADTDIQFTGLDDGYYLIVASNGTKLILQSLGDVTIKEKNEYITDTKEVEEADLAVGELAHFTITIGIPETTAVGTVITVHDTMDSELTYNNDVAATFGTDPVALTDVDPAVAGEIFTKNFTVADGMPGNNVVLTYTATLNETADPDLDGFVNESFAATPYFETLPTTVRVYTFDFNLKKNFTGVPAASAANYSATFNLSKGGTTLKFVYDDTTGEYVLALDQSSASASADLVVTGASAINIRGLDAGDYVLTETDTADGFNMLTETIDVKITDTTPDAGKNDPSVVPTWKVEYKMHSASAYTESDTATVAVDNNPGTQLPSTGGIGTTIFYVAGLIMVLGAATILIARRKADAE